MTSCSTSTTTTPSEQPLFPLDQEEKMQKWHGLKEEWQSQQQGHKHILSMTVRKCTWATVRESHTESKRLKENLNMRSSAERDGVQYFLWEKGHMLMKKKKKNLHESNGNTTTTKNAKISWT